MELDIFFSPIDEIKYEKESIAENFTSFFLNKKFPDWQNADIVLIGVCEARNSTSNKGCDNGQSRIRESLYRLNSTVNCNVADLGNIVQGLSLIHI